eukprot:807181-Lingulodinium_polyedra.AAC.1
MRVAAFQRRAVSALARVRRARAIFAAAAWRTRARVGRAALKRRSVRLNAPLRMFKLKVRSGVFPRASSARARVPRVRRAYR